MMDHESDNFTAELLLKELGALYGTRGSTAAGAAAVRDLLGNIGVPLAGVRIVDGSGLSLLDRLTAQALVAILEASWLDPDIRPTLISALPVAGVSGTLERRMKTAPARGNVIAKTGTTDEASALAGFVRGRYVFAVLQNGHPVSATWARDGAGPLRDAPSLAVAPRDRPRRGSARRAFSAFAAFEPGLSPTNTPVVFFETLSETFAPSASSAARASSRV